MIFYRIPVSSITGVLGTRGVGARGPWPQGFSGSSGSQRGERGVGISGLGSRALGFGDFGFRA